MTRHNAMVGVLAAAGVGTLGWFATKIVAAHLPLGAGIAAWTLWLIVAAALVTFAAYARELLRHNTALRRGGSWKPLPGLALLWIAGLTALVSFGFVLPDAPASAEGTNRATTSTTTTPSPAATTGSPSRKPATSPASRSSARQTPADAGSTSSSLVRSTTPAGVSTPTSSSRTSSNGDSLGTTSPTAPPTSSATSPLLDLHILPTRAKPTTPPGR